MRDEGIRWMFQVSLLDRGCPFVGNGPKYPRLVLFQRSAASVSFLIRLCASRSREQGCLYWNAKSREWDTRALDCRKRGRGNLIRNKDEILEKFHRPLCITVPQRVCQARMFFFLSNIARSAYSQDRWADIPGAGHGCLCADGACL